MDKLLLSRLTVYNNTPEILVTIFQVQSYVAKTNLEVVTLREHDK